MPTMPPQGGIVVFAISICPQRLWMHATRTCGKGTQVSDGEGARTRWEVFRQRHRCRAGELRGCARLARAAPGAKRIRFERRVFHSLCGWLAGMPVEKHGKSLMALHCAHAAKNLVMRATLPHAKTVAPCVELCARRRGCDKPRQCCPQVLWMFCGRACGKDTQVPDGIGVRRCCEYFGHAGAASRSEKRLRHTRNHASLPPHPLVMMHVDPGASRQVFHRRCGCSAGELVEKVFKCLMVLMCARAANVLSTRVRVARGEKALASCAESCIANSTMTRYPLVTTSADPHALRGVFHRRCGCRPGEPVENTSKCLIAQRRGHAAEIFVMPSSWRRGFPQALWKSFAQVCGQACLRPLPISTWHALMNFSTASAAGRATRFSTASVEAPWANLWISAIGTFADSHLSRVVDVLFNESRASGCSPRNSCQGSGRRSGLRCTQTLRAVLRDGAVDGRVVPLSPSKGDGWLRTDAGPWTRWASRRGGRGSPIRLDKGESLFQIAATLRHSAIIHCAAAAIIGHRVSAWRVVYRFA